MPQLHMPLQSGSDQILKAMRRSYRKERYLEIIENVKKHLPDAALTTDVIVGFPGETEEDLQETIDVIQKARFAATYTFQYSKRPGTPAAELPDQIPQALVQERFERLLKVVNQVAWEENLKQVGKKVEVLVAPKEGKKDSATHRLSGRTKENRLVHFAYDESQNIRPGDFVTTEITYAAPYHLVADAGCEVRRSKAGDFWEVRNSEKSNAVTLGMPVLINNS
jgi:tRNA-2-methylthio-N6-dimethylallyladenosine synthase